LQVVLPRSQTVLAVEGFFFTAIAGIGGLTWQRPAVQWFIRSVDSLRPRRAWEHMAVSPSTIFIDAVSKSMARWPHSPHHGGFCSENENVYLVTGDALTPGGSTPTSRNTAPLRLCAFCFSNFGIADGLAEYPPTARLLWWMKQKIYDVAGIEREGRFRLGGCGLTGKGRSLAIGRFVDSRRITLRAFVTGVRRHPGPGGKETIIF